MPQCSNGRCPLAETPAGGRLARSLLHSFAEVRFSMRQHFHRCPQLRAVTVDASDVSGDRKGGRFVLDELCAAKGLAPCVGLVDCDLLSYAEKRELLVARVTELRERTGGETAIGDIGGTRGREIERLALELIEERQEILNANQRLLAEATAAFDAQPKGAPLGAPEDLGPDLAVHAPALQAGRLDAIDRALEAMGAPGYGVCACCQRFIARDRLRAAPDTRVCSDCAKAARTHGAT
jgi:RNA polymerase-binding transcription factor DksA